MRLSKGLIFNMLKGLYLFIVGFFYLFPNSILTRIIYPYGNKGLFGSDFYLKFNGRLIDIIDLNIPHVIAFIGLGMLFKWWGLLFVVLLEVAQWLVKGEFALIDIGLNMTGLLIGIFARWCYGKIKKKK